MNAPNTSLQRRRDLLVAAACGVFVAAMVGAAYAAVPLYDWFCRTTGFGGTPQVATAAPSHTLDRKLKVRFDANVVGGLPWRLEPEQNSIEVKIGEVVTVNYRVVNVSARETVGIASYNVSPPTAGAYFSKINCFCFTDQRLKAGREARHGGRVLRRPRARDRIRSRTVSTPSRSPTPCIRCASRRRRAWRIARPARPDEAERRRGKRAQAPLPH